MSDGENAKNKEKILLVDDDTFLRDMYVKKFKDDGFEVNHFSEVSSALEDLRGEFKPNIVITDLVMPGQTGWDFIKSIRNEGLAKEATVIVLSNEDIEKSKEDGENLNIDGYIVKSMATPSEVLKTVKDIHLSKE